MKSKSPRVDHIGSTSIPDIAAKPIIDIQVSVGEFEPIERLTEPLEAIGYAAAWAIPSWRSDEFAMRAHQHEQLTLQPRPQRPVFPAKIEGLRPADAHDVE
ncbi:MULTISPECIES: GrpB family protein [unclassified Mesorhizobium]|uniref:GrpB family protein n=1 Tax=unclassified Mesorhizobium TaxID=325217 RepID=UPI000FE94EB5|nr:MULTISPECIES: GrpB family protein [unclassified Mesorhizobium]RWB93772.1 MAG: hypothetical protein EOQ57_33535 [Mesorhizobium sp.]TGV18179.1 hypothetical protein EN786_34775 [Mesorhizobium sp. M4B.F.Ca.ET.143.01.1.1]